MSKTILGLDLGPSSVGWALLSADDQLKPTGLVKCGVRVFPAPVDPESHDLLNVHRRMARGARRLCARRRQRRDLALRILREAELLPATEPELRKLFSDNARNPYVLRSEALHSELIPFELGKALFHLCKRRGFKSNRRSLFTQLERNPEAWAEVRGIVEAEEAEDMRKAAAKRAMAKGSAVAKEDPDAKLAQIASLEELLQRQGLTLGQYLATLLDQNKNNQADPTSRVRLRNLETSRRMYENEFDRIWEAQAHFRPEALTRTFRRQLFEAIFDQGPLKVQRFLTGDCTFEPNRKRARLACSIAHRFSIWGDVRNIKVAISPREEELPLSWEQRNRLFDALNRAKTMNWNSVKTLLGYPKSAVINLERSKEDGLTGNATEVDLSGMISDWDRWTGDDRAALEVDLLTIDRKDALYLRLRHRWKFDVELAYRLTTWEPTSGVASLSAKAMSVLIPILASDLDEITVRQACVVVANELKSQAEETEDPRLRKILEAREKNYRHAESEPSDDRLLPLLPEPFKGRFPLDTDPRLPKVTNPVVRKCLHQVRQVVSAICRQYGPPDLIRIELARDMKLTEREKAIVRKLNARNKSDAKDARDALVSENWAVPNSTNLRKYRLWKECGGVCPYTGRSISLGMLFPRDGSPPGAEVEHIIPYFRSLDESYRNVTLCVTSANRTKSNKTPFEAYAGRPEVYGEILDRVRRFPSESLVVKWESQGRIKSEQIQLGGHKIKLFELDLGNLDAKRKREGREGGLLDMFIGRRLPDTGYGAREATKYLKFVAEVETTKGEATHALAYKWGLSSILWELHGEVPPPEEPDRKYREDHRHHAIDAIVIALTSKALFQRLSKLSAESGLGLTEQRFKLDDPWPGFRRSEVLEAVRDITVSFGSKRKIRGALHSEQPFGKIRHSSTGREVYVQRKTLDETIKKGHLDAIVDRRIRELALARYASASGDNEADRLRSAFGDPSKPLLIRDRHGRMHPVRRVRVEVADADKSVFGVDAVRGSPDTFRKYFDYGKYHHVEIVECVRAHTDADGRAWKVGERRGLFVSMAEAAKQVRRLKGRYVNDDHGPDWRLALALSEDEHVVLDPVKEPTTCRVQVLSASDQRVGFRLHTASTVNRNSERWVRNVSSSHRWQKISVDPLGQRSP